MISLQSPGPESRSRSPVADRERFNALVADVRAARPRLIDIWEATALIESFGYSDARVQREFGLADTLAAGTLTFEVCVGHPGVMERWKPKIERVPTIVARCAASTLIYAVPWLTVFVAQTIRPDALRFSGVLAPPMVLALMFSLVWTGGFVQAIVRRGEFYIGLKQYALAREVVTAIFWVGLVSSVAAAIAGIGLGWYFELFSWPSLVFGGDAFIVMSGLWLVCGLFGIRQQQWRVALALVAGFSAFVAGRAMGADVLTAESVAVLTVVVAAALQARQLFFPSGVVAVWRSPDVSMPRLHVLVCSTLPYVWYGAVYFGFLFADRIAAGTATAALGEAGFGVPTPYSLGMELSLLTLLIAASGVEVAGALFARALAIEAQRPIAGGTGDLAAALRRHHRRAITLAGVTFLATAMAVALLAERLLPLGIWSLPWATLVPGEIGYALLAVGFVNALILFETQRPWTVVRSLTGGLVLNLAAGYVLSHAYGSVYAVDGLVAGAAYFAIASTRGVRLTLETSDYAYAAGQ